MTTPLHTTPADTTPDSGPRHHGGALALLAALMATLTALFAAGLCVQFSRPGLIAPALVLFGLPAAWWWWCVWQAARHAATPPSSHRVLAGLLGFDLICTCRGVAPTMFFHPDKTTAGSALDLCVFLENYTSRQRVVELQVGPHPGLGFDRMHKVSLHLAAGQAAVYRWPLRTAATLPEGAHDLPVVMQVRRPEGSGQWLPGVRRHPYDIWHTRFAVPFTLEAADKKNPAPPLPEASYLSLASISEKEPRLDVLARFVDPA